MILTDAPKFQPFTQRYPPPFVPQVKEAAEQARAATVATSTVAGSAEAARNVAQAFAQPEEEEPQRPAPLGTTLSSLLTFAEQLDLLFSYFFPIM